MLLWGDVTVNVPSLLWCNDKPLFDGGQTMSHSHIAVSGHSDAVI